MPPVTSDGPLESGARLGEGGPDQAGREELPFRTATCGSPVATAWAITASSSVSTRTNRPGCLGLGRPDQAPDGRVHQVGDVLLADTHRARGGEDHDALGDVLGVGLEVRERLGGGAAGPRGPRRRRTPARTAPPCGRARRPPGSPAASRACRRRRGGWWPSRGRGEVRAPMVATGAPVGSATVSVTVPGPVGVRRTRVRWRRWRAGRRRTRRTGGRGRRPVRRKPACRAASSRAGWMPNPGAGGSAISA